MSGFDVGAVWMLTHNPHHRLPTDHQRAVHEFRKAGRTARRASRRTRRLEWRAEQRLRWSARRNWWSGLMRRTRAEIRSA